MTTTLSWTLSSILAAAAAPGARRLNDAAGPAAAAGSLSVSATTTTTAQAAASPTATRMGLAAAEDPQRSRQSTAALVAEAKAPPTGRRGSNSRGSPPPSLTMRQVLDPYYNQQQGQQQGILGIREHVNAVVWGLPHLHTAPLESALEIRGMKGLHLRHLVDLIAHEAKTTPAVGSYLSSGDFQPNGYPFVPVITFNGLQPVEVRNQVGPHTSVTATVNLQRQWKASGELLAGTNVLPDLARFFAARAKDSSLSGNARSRMKRLAAEVDAAAGKEEGMAAVAKSGDDGAKTRWLTREYLNKKLGDFFHAAWPERLDNAHWVDIATPTGTGAGALIQAPAASRSSANKSAAAANNSAADDDDDDAAAANKPSKGKLYTLDSQEARQRIVREVAALRILWQCNHAVGLRGYMTREPESRGVPELLLVYKDKYKKDGVALSDRLNGGEPAPPLLERLEICVALATALEAVHKYNVVHGDVVPESFLLFDRPGGPWFHAKMRDFGLAAAVPDGDSFVKAMLEGTAGYIAPELQPDVQKKGLPTDVYALGKTILEVLNWKCDPNSMWRHGTGGEGVFDDALLSKTLDRNPTERPTAEQVLGRLSWHLDAMKHAERERDAAISKPPTTTITEAAPLPQAKGGGGSRERHSTRVEISRPPSPPPSPPPVVKRTTLEIQ